MDLNYYNVFSDAGYTIVANNTELQAAPDSDKLLGIFSISNMAKWLDRNVFTDNVEGNEDAPSTSLNPDTAIEALLANRSLLLQIAREEMQPISRVSKR